MADREKTLFEKLNAINVNDHTEQRQNLTYLSWAWAWTELMKVCPNAKYEVKMFDGKPYLYDEMLGYMVFTSITIGDDTKEMWLPVMDGANKAMKAHPYKYYVKSWEFDEEQRRKVQKQIEKTCDAASMFDINKTIMRCLTKNISMFGLGLYIYAGEDLPEETEEPKPTNKSGIWDEETPAQKKENQKSLKILADQFRNLVPQDAQEKILAELKLEKAEELGTVNLERYLEHYGKK